VHISRIEREEDEGCSRFPVVYDRFICGNNHTSGTDIPENQENICIFRKILRENHCFSRPRT
jgi:hypothetical protein